MRSRSTECHSSHPVFCLYCCCLQGTTNAQRISSRCTQSTVFNVFHDSSPISSSPFLVIYFISYFPFIAHRLDAGSFLFHLFAQRWQFCPPQLKNLFVFSSENSTDFFVSNLKLSFVRRRHFSERFFTFKTNLSNALSLELEAIVFELVWRLILKGLIELILAKLKNDLRSKVVKKWFKPH